MTPHRRSDLDADVSRNLAAEGRQALTSHGHSCWVGDVPRAAEEAAVRPPIPVRSALAGVPGLRVEALADELVEAHGHDPRGSYARQFWLPLVGPSTLLTAGLLVGGLEHAPGGFWVDLARLGHALGLPGAAGANAKIVRTLDRLVRFGLADLHAGGPVPLLRVRRAWPPLTARQRSRLPSFLAASHPAA